MRRLFAAAFVGLIALASIAIYQRVTGKSVATLGAKT